MPRENGIKGFTADVLAGNHAMMDVFQNVAGKLETELQAGIYHIRFDLAEVDAA